MSSVFDVRSNSESSEIRVSAASGTGQPIILKLLPALEWIVLAVLAAAFVAFSIIPGWRTLRSEFPNYYLAAELYHQGIPLDRAYEWAWFQRQNDHLQVRDGLVSFAPNPPSSVLPLLPYARLTPLAAKQAWMVTNLALLALSLFALRKTTQLGWRRLVLITLLSTLPLKTDFLFARYYVLILFLICVAYYAACRNQRLASGIAWSTAAAIKLFPAIAVILFLRRRDWRALAGFLAGGLTLAMISLAFFGIDVHQVFVREVLSQASRGDWLGPYSLYQNSFITLWSHFFLIEPELNPAPLINSHFLYALAMGATVTALVFGFLLAIRREDSSHAEALRWASLLPLMLLLSTYSSADHSCILIFTAIVGIDALLAAGRWKKALTLLFLYTIAAAPIPHSLTNSFPHRLFAITALYIFLLHCMWDGETTRQLKRWRPAAAVVMVGLAVYNYNLTNRGDDFSRRVPIQSRGYRFANPVSVENGFAVTEMLDGKYRPVVLAAGVAHDLSRPGDALSIAGSPASGIIYSEFAKQKSLIVRISSTGISETIAEGQDPVLSANGKWLAFIREDRENRTAWLWQTDSSSGSQLVLASAHRPLDVTVTNEGDVIASAGKVSDPHLLVSRRATAGVTQLSDIPGPVRYPAASPDGKRLAFSRREHGSWHLFVRRFATGREQQLTDLHCNAISPSWADDHTLLYATDCGRGVGMSAIARVVLPD
ncbi:MAG: glycosyltransferase 87 family protein [Candidatus Sulfotelmatobacter sp.]